MTPKLLANLRDAFLHIPLFAAYAVVVYAALKLAPPVLAAVLAGVFIGYIREVTQAQHKYDNRIWTGWGLTLGSHIEWILPGVVLIGLALALT